VSAATEAGQLSLGLTPEPGRPSQAAGPGSAAIMEALQRHYRKPGEERNGEILLPEVQAPGSQRRADLVRVGMWHSRGTGVDVHEIKVSRADWLRELDDPAKAEAWWPHCNRFWVVAPPGVVAPGELPEGWGLMELPSSGRRFKVRVPAATRPVTLTAGLLVELLRRADNQRLAEMDQMRRQHDNDMHKLGEEWRARKAEAAMPPGVKARLDMLTAIEAALGVPLDDFGGWPKLPPSAITPAELAAFLADARDHVTVRRRPGPGPGEAPQGRRRRARAPQRPGTVGRAAPPLSPIPRHLSPCARPSSR
jgi:hypothetical protein